MRVVIKANLVSAMKPEKAATTHPALLSALTHLLREKGAHVVIGDSPGGTYAAPHFGHQGIIRYSFQMKIGSGGSFFRFIHSQPSTV